MIKRNDKCWCGSEEKYKKCHMEFDEKIQGFKNKGYEVPDRSIIKTPAQIEKIKASAKINNEILDLVGEKIKAGMTTNEIDQIVHDYTVSQGAVPAPLGYSGFPKSCCTSVNDQICHGIPDDYVLKDGDIINVDVSTILDGYYSDASRMYMIGEVADNAKRLVEVTKECLLKGIEKVKPWTRLGEVAHAVQQHAESNGYSVV